MEKTSYKEKPTQPPALDIQKLMVKLDEVDMNTGRIILPTSSQLKQMSSRSTTRTTPPIPKAPSEVDDDDLGEASADQHLEEREPIANTEMPPRYTQKTSGTQDKSYSGNVSGDGYQHEPIYKSSNHDMKNVMLASLAIFFALLILILSSIAGVLWIRSQEYAERISQLEAIPKAQENIQLSSAIAYLSEDLQSLQQELITTNRTLANFSVSVVDEEAPIEGFSIEDEFIEDEEPAEVIEETVELIEEEAQ